MNYYVRLIPNDEETRAQVRVSDTAPDGDGWQQMSEEEFIQWRDSLTPLPTPSDTITYTAEEWLDAQGVGGARQPTLLYLRQSLAAASKESPLLNSLEQYLQTILALYAADPTPRADWPLPPTTFEAAVQQAVALITPQ